MGHQSSWPWDQESADERKRGCYQRYPPFAGLLLFKGTIVKLDCHVYQRGCLFGVQRLSADTVLCSAIDFVVRNGFLDVVYIEIPRELPSPDKRRLVVPRIDAE